MKLTHHYFTLIGPSTIKHVCKPLFAVNYINSRLSEFFPYKDITTTPLKHSGEIRSKINISENTYIILQGATSEILPVIAWLNEAKSIYLEFMDSQI